MFALSSLHRMGDLLWLLQITADEWTFIGGTPEKGWVALRIGVVQPVGISTSLPQMSYESPTGEVLHELNNCLLFSATL